MNLQTLVTSEYYIAGLNNFGFGDGANGCEYLQQVIIIVYRHGNFTDAVVW